MSSTNSTPKPPIILYLYPFSPYGRKISTYLLLRRIPYSEVHQPAMPPRPDLDAFSIRYRLIPVMSIGRDFYCDTTIILAKLEALYPGSEKHPALGAKDGKGKAMERLLEEWGNDTVFARVRKTMSPELPVFQDEKFLKDRAELWGETWEVGNQKKVRPKGLQNLNEVFGVLENIVADGDDFAFGSSPGLIDIHALVLFNWLQELLPGTIPDSALASHPKASAWLSRYASARSSALARAGDAPTLDGPTAAKQVYASDFAEPEGNVDPEDPVAEALGLQKGTQVEVWPEDVKSGQKHKEVGKLVALTKEEVAVAVAQKEGGELRVHFPRWNYRVEKATG